MALVLSLPLVTGHLPGSSHLQGLIASAPSSALGALKLPEVSGTTAQQGPAGTAVRLTAGRASDTPLATPTTAASADRYRITPERRALLNTIRFAEGTWTGGRPDGYRMIYGGRLVSDLARHPEITVRGGYVSAAAGAYQFLPGTWRDAARRLGLRDFGPASQDQAALYLIEKRGVLRHVDRGDLSEEVLARLAPEWSSLPTLAGSSYYGQPVHQARSLVSFYRAELSRQRGERAAGLQA